MSDEEKALAAIRFFAKTKILWGACEGCDPGNEGSEIAGEVLAAADTLEAALGPQLTAEDLDVIDWYRVCLENVQAGKPVRGLDEAKLGYERVHRRLSLIANA